LRAASFLPGCGGLRFATPLLVVLMMVETTDVVFAADSIPAILAISGDTFIAYTSNVFALRGLRALYFALASLLTRFHYLH
jgi:tellurite resistance protein TerC